MEGLWGWVGVGSGGILLESYNALSLHRTFWAKSFYLIPPTPPALLGKGDSHPHLQIFHATAFILLHE